MDSGGAPTTQPGYGPNTRTVMQIRVAADAVRRAAHRALRRGHAPESCSPRRPRHRQARRLRGLAGRRSSCPRRPTTRPTTPPSRRPSPRSTSRSWTCPRPSRPSTPPPGWPRCTPVDITFENKAIHDEMGAAYDHVRADERPARAWRYPTSPTRQQEHPALPAMPARPPTSESRCCRPPWSHGGRHPDLEDHPQRRRHPPHPRPPVQRPADQPGRLGRGPAYRPTPTSWAGRKPCG